MLSESQVSQFDRDGFLLSSKVLSDDEVESLCGQMLGVIENRDSPGVRQPVLCRDIGQKGSPIWQIVNIWQASEEFARLIRHPMIVQEVAQLTRAKQLKIWHDQIQYKPAGTGGVNMWHQDAPYWPVLTCPTEVTAWIALDDVDSTNGCMSMVPGSHRWGNAIEFLHTLKSFDAMPRQHVGHEIEVKLAPVRRGHVHYHHAMTWHGSHANTSPRQRRAIALHYMTEQTCLAEGGDHPMKRFITSAAGEPVEGTAFPVVWP